MFGVGFGVRLGWALGWVGFLGGGGFSLTRCRLVGWAMVAGVVGLGLLGSGFNRFW